MRIAFDTNILLYAEGTEEPTKAAKAQVAITRFAGDRMHLPSQVVLEGARALRTKLKLPGRRHGSSSSRGGPPQPSCSLMRKRLTMR
jgi:predicted nucleic acid-binding protein